MAEKSKITGEEEKNRGTQDELEVLKIIIESHPGLKARVLSKIRQMTKEEPQESGRLKVGKQKKVS